MALAYIGLNSSFFLRLSVYTNSYIKIFYSFMKYTAIAFFHAKASADIAIRKVKAKPFLIVLEYPTLLTKVFFVLEKKCLIFIYRCDVTQTISNKLSLPRSQESLNRRLKGLLPFPICYTEKDSPAADAGHSFVCFPIQSHPLIPLIMLGTKMPSFELFQSNMA